MGLFSKKNEPDASTESSRDMIKETVQIRKNQEMSLAVERKKNIELAAQVAALKNEIEQLKAALVKLRRRQKASVERAKRFKVQLTSTRVATQ